MQKKRMAESLLSKIFVLTVSLLSKVIFWNKEQRIWLVACGGERWGDSAEAFWRYMNENHPEILTSAVLKNKSAIPYKKNRVKRNSLYNYLMILNAEVLATTHTLSDIGPESLTSASKAKKVWLQHGVIAIGKITASHARVGKYDLICTSSEREKEIMTNVMGIKPDLIAVTGLARHDYLKAGLKEVQKREGIFYLPTSRSWASKESGLDYYRILFSWLKCLDRAKVNSSINIWLHPNWYSTGLRETLEKDQLLNLVNLNKDPQELLIHSKLFITDYSSVFFDAALSGIPTIFFQPDRDEYINKKGLLDDFLAQDDLLVVEDQESLAKQIEEIMNNKDYYQARLAKDRSWALKYVTTFDGHSCERIYDETSHLLNQ